MVFLLAQQGRSEREGLSVQGTGCGKMVPDKSIILSEIATANTHPVLKDMLIKAEVCLVYLPPVCT